MGQINQKDPADFMDKLPAGWHYAIYNQKGEMTCLGITTKEMPVANLVFNSLSLHHVVRGLKAGDLKKHFVIATDPGRQWIQIAHREAL